MDLRRLGIGWLLLILGLSLLALPAGAEVKPGDNLSGLSFPAPMSPEDAKYLGVAADKPFKLGDINAPYLLLEVFATSCSHCFQQAPGMNKIHELIQKDPKLAGKVRLLAVGAGDNQFAVMMWKRQLQIPFPIVPDTDLQVTNKINILGTPTTILLEKGGKVLLAHAGAFEDANAFFKELQALIK